MAFGSDELMVRFRAAIKIGGAVSQPGPEELSASSGYFGADRMEVGWWNVYRPEFLPLLTSYLGVRPNSSVLEIGCGTAFLSRTLARSVEGLALTGLDPDVEALRRGTSLVAEDGLSDRIELVEGDAYALPFPNEHFDTIASQNLL